jgi:hypothetical protein
MKMTPKQKPYVIGGALALLAFLILRKKDPDRAEATALANEATTAGKKSYADSQYYAWSNRLESTMFDWGTNEDSLYSVFRSLKNNADFIALKEAFGMRTYTGGIVPGFFYGKYSLDQWIEEELNPEEIALVNNILSSKGITYRF